MCSLLLSACSAIRGAETGSWSEDRLSFTNEWANFRFDLPDGWRALSAEEMETQLSAGEDILVNDGTNRTAIDVALFRTAYDFIVTTEDGLPNAIVAYENLALVPGAGSVDAEGYYEILKPQLLAITSMAYTEVGTSVEIIAGEEYYVGTFAVSGGIFYQDYYLRKVGKVIMSIIVTYTEDTAADAADFLDGIQPVK
jgi:hypothetical protein